MPARAPTTEFASLHSYSQFEQSVKTKARFVHDDEVREFLRIVLETSRMRRRRLKKDRILFRAQTGFTRTTEPLRIGDQETKIEVIDVPAAHPPERMVPKSEYVGDGRVNPRGIPCLYLASNASAAMSEMRPWVGLYVTLAQFKMVRDCQVVDCSLSMTRSDFLELVDLDSIVDPSEPDAVTREAGVWGDIGFAFSKPVTRDQPHLDYVPTQVLAEAFRSHGYDGIAYKSLLDERGKNVALFDLVAAKVINCCLYKTKAASLEFVRQDDNLGCQESILSEFRRSKGFDDYAPEAAQ
jgi:RES domain-containing protein